MADIIPVKVRAFNGEPVIVEGYATDVPGLVVSRDIWRPERWGLTHVASGKQLGHAFGTVEDCVASALLIVDMADFTLPEDELKRSLDHQAQTALHSIIAQAAEDCEAALQTREVTT